LWKYRSIGSGTLPPLRVLSQGIGARGQLETLGLAIAVALTI